MEDIQTNFVIVFAVKRTSRNGRSVLLRTTYCRDVVVIESSAALCVQGGGTFSLSERSSRNRRNMYRRDVVIIESSAALYVQRGGTFSFSTFSLSKRSSRNIG